MQKTPLPPFWWDVVRRNPGRITVLLLIMTSELRKEWRRQSEQSEEADAPEAVDQPLAPPLIDNRRRLSSPLKERQRTSSPIAFDDESR